MYKRHNLGLAVLLVANIFATSSIAQPIPHPPKTGIEIFNPVDRMHSVVAKCAASEATVRWTFLNGKVHFDELRLNAMSASEQMLLQLDEAAATFKGDALVRLDCSNGGAAITLIEERSAGSARSKGLRFDYVGGKLESIY